MVTRTWCAAMVDFCACPACQRVFVCHAGHRRQHVVDRNHSRPHAASLVDGELEIRLSSPHLLPATSVASPSIRATRSGFLWVTISQIGGPLVYRSDNGGGSWVNCTPGLPNIPMNSVVVDLVTLNGFGSLRTSAFTRRSTWAQAGLLFQTDFRMQWPPICSFISRTACSSAGREIGGWVISVP